MIEPPPMSERDWQKRVMDTAMLHGWRVNHALPARTLKGWHTATQGHAGLPDLTLARKGQLILAELKTDIGRPTPAQQAWLDEVGEHGRLWRPRDWNAVLAELSAPIGVKS